MVPYWFENALPPSRHTIENAVRLGLWGAGLGGVYVTCVRETVPYACECTWYDTPFTLEWAPMDYLVLRIREPALNQEKLEVFETHAMGLRQAFTHLLNHRPLAAYREDNGDLVIEWRVRELKQRLAEIEAGNVKYLEKF